MSEMDLVIDSLKDIKDTVDIISDKVEELEKVNIAKDSAKKERNKIIGVTFTLAMAFGTAMYNFILVPVVKLTESNKLVAQAMDDRTNVLINLSDTDGN